MMKMTSQVKREGKCSRAEEMTVRIKHFLQKLEVGSSDPQHSRECQVGFCLQSQCMGGRDRDPQSWIARVTRLADSGLK